MFGHGKILNRTTLATLYTPEVTALSPKKFQRLCAEDAIRFHGFTDGVLGRARIFSDERLKRFHVIDPLGRFL
jgi:hypothetical protein